MPNKNAAANRVKSIGKIFESLGYNVYFVGISHEREQLTFLPINGSHSLFYMSFKYPQGLKEQLSFFFSSKAFMRVLKSFKDLDAVICFDFQALPFKKIIRYCKHKNIPVISDTTEWTNTNGSFIKRIIKFFDTEYRMRLLNKRCDCVISISDYLFEYYKKKHVFTIKIPVLVDNELLIKSTITPYKTKHFVYAGSTDKSKDRLDTIVNAFSSLREVRDDFVLDVLGLTYQDYSKVFKTTIKEELLRNAIVFHGFLDHSHCVNIISNSSYTIFVRRKSRKNIAGFPTKFAESISCGVPVVTNRIENISSYFVDGENGFLLPNDHKGIVEKLNYILDISNQDYAKIKQNCIEDQSFDYHRYINVFAELFEKITRTL